MSLTEGSIVTIYLAPEALNEAFVRESDTAEIINSAFVKYSDVKKLLAPDGGSAFGEFHKAGELEVKQGGMSLRDYFAAKASDSDVQAIINHWWQTTCGSDLVEPTRAQARYMHADAMLAERAK